MKILKTTTLRGPNYWSIRRSKLIVMRVDLEGIKDRPSNTIPGFYSSLIKLLPSLEEHNCSLGCRGGFLQRVREGTMMGHIVEHIALELQELAGMSVGFGRTRETATDGIYNVVFEYVEERSGRYAGRAAVRLCNSIIENGVYPKQELEQDLEDLRDLYANAAHGPSTETILKEVVARNIPWIALNARAMIQLGYGKHQKRIQATLSQHSSILGVELACDKEGTKNILSESGIPVPRGTVIRYLDELEDAIADVGGYPIAIKPLDGNHGRGITLNITSAEEAEKAYDLAQSASKIHSVIVERFYSGNDHRILVIDGKLVAAAKRIPACVEGDGKSNISQLIERTNKDPKRGEGHDNILTKIKIDDNSLALLAKQGLTTDTVLKKGEIAYLKATANLSTGGIAVDCTDSIHPDNIWLAERVARIIGLDIAGIDIVTPDITKPLKEVDGVVVEVNAAPGFRMHAAPSIGKPRNIAAPVLDMLFPPGTPIRIPIIAITGTNGKTTTTRLITHIWRETGSVVGYTTTDGIYINDRLVHRGDNTGPDSAKVILRDPTVEVAVLETARGGMLRAGLGFDRSDVGVVLNVAADHLGIGDIDTIEQMARLKGVIAETVKSDGYAVLNADDPRVAAMAERTQSKVAYFSMNPDNPIIQNWTKNGGLAAVYENGYISLLEGETLTRLDLAAALPVTMSGMAPFMIANSLAALLAAYTSGVDLATIRTALKTFTPNANQTPGRMNLFDLGSYHALVDYAHNPDGYKAVGSFVQNWNGERIGIVGGPGDRRDEDLILLGEIAARVFDRIIVKEDDDKRGRSVGEVANLIVSGIQQANGKIDYQTILSESQAIESGLDLASAGGLVVVFPESITRAIELIRKRQPCQEMENAE